MKKIEPKTLSGFMELNPEDQILFDEMLNIIKNTYKSYGYWSIDTPIIEYSEVLLAKAGGETEKQIYRFNKGDNDLSLRFDLTVPLAKYVALKYNELLFPFKRYQIGKVFRGERPQKGRFREFYQCDIDVIGDNELSLKYDAEIIYIIYDIFNKLDIGKFNIKISNRKIITGFLKSLNIENNNIDVLRIVDKISKIGTDKTKKMLYEIINDKTKVDKIINLINIKGNINEVISKLNNLNINEDIYQTGVLELSEVINDLKQMKLEEKCYSIDLSITRGLDYYTSTVYETILIDYPEIGSICSGGRYDDLATFYTDKKLPGVGASIGLTRLFNQLKEAKIINNTECRNADVMILPMGITDYSLVYVTSNLLRSNGYSVSIPYNKEKFKNKIKYASRMNAKYSIFIGEDEVKEGMVTIKNMETRNQVKLSLEEILDYMSKENN